MTQISGLPLPVRAQGAGSTTLLLLHYFGGAGHAWDGVGARLAATFRCLAPDMRGFGDAPDTPPDTGVAQGADELAALIAALDLDRYIFVGHSMSGKIAMALAARQPAGLRGLVLVAPSPLSPEPIADAERQRLLQGHGDRSQAEQTARAISAHPLPPADHTQVVADNIRSGRNAWRAWLEHGSREDLMPLAARIAVPTTVIVGSADTVLPAALLTREVVQRIAGSSLVELPDSGHLLPLEAPDALASAIRSVCK